MQLTHNKWIEKKQQQGEQELGLVSEDFPVINPHTVKINHSTPFFIRCARLISYAYSERSPTHLSDLMVHLQVNAVCH